MTIVVEVWLLVAIDAAGAVWLGDRAREDSLNGVHDGDSRHSWTDLNCSEANMEEGEKERRDDMMSICVSRSILNYSARAKSTKAGDDGYDGKEKASQPTYSRHISLYEPVHDSWKGARGRVSGDSRPSLSRIADMILAT